MFNIQKLERQFRRMGARLRVTTVLPREVEQKRPLPRKHHRWVEWAAAHPFSIDIRREKGEECFALRVGDNSSIPPGFATDRIDLASIKVLDVQPKDRHLVLQVVCGEGKARQVDTFLCGHDERHWFVARTSGTSVQKAKEDLKPQVVKRRQARLGVKRSKRNKRKNEAFVRQGEWFFLPSSNFEVGKFTVISKNEPLQRGAGKPHIAEECCRVGGTTVMVHRRLAPNGISMDRYNKLQEETRRQFGWRPMVRDATVYVRGKIRHPDHKTLKLRGWHRVEANTEQVRGWNGRLQTMTFLD